MSRPGHWSLRAPRRHVGHPSLRGSHHGVGDDLPHGHRDRGRRRRVGDGGGQPGARPRQGRAAPPAAAGDVHRGRGRDRAGVRPSTRVRPGAPVARRGRRGTGRDRRRRRPGPVVPGAVGRRRVVRLGPVPSFVQGEQAGFALHHRKRADAERPGCGAQSEIAARLDDTVSAWQSWSELHQAYVGPWRDLVHHSGRVLQALSFQPTGAICAAATTSLPEVVGGTRNWDYRYAWVRDASFTIEALWVAACPDEANEFFDYMTASAAGSLEHGRRPADHVRHRRRAGPDRAGAAPPAGLAAVRAGAGRQRRVAPAPARRLRRAAQRGAPTVRPALRPDGAPVGPLAAATDGTRRPSWPRPPDGSSSSSPTPPPGAGRRRTTASGRSGASPATSSTPS